MIVYQVRDDLHCPVIICDACGDVIERHGNAYWLDLGDDSPQLYPDVWHTHKRCGNFDKVIERELGGQVLFEELSVHLEQIRHNLTSPLPRCASKASEASKAGFGRLDRFGRTSLRRLDRR